ncbi:putative clathrin assembly protein [Platanthera zijinensis]|uniref:Clathrin assembly protein n=1 Tax=Platanthera zijinensis TaxID=2320716 RepID=A0AAP0B8M9_9ASPA
MAPSTIRKAIGVVKDQTSISLAKVSSNIAPDLDVAIVKATSHEDEPADERHIREIINLTSYSRGYVGACVAAVSRRLGKTRDWIVALKTLMLVHRLLVDGDPVLHHEFLYATRRGTRLLSMSDFRDEAHSSSWDHSAFIRTFALFLDQRLECIIQDQKHAGDGGGGGGSFQSPREQTRSQLPYQYSDQSNPNQYQGGGNYERNSNSHYSPTQVEERKPATPLREMKPEKVLARMNQLQQLLDRFLACRPTGGAKDSRLVLIALYPIVRDSFQLYADICEILAVLLDRYFEMEYADCLKTFEAYGFAAKQIDELSAFYGWCKNTGVARSSEYPEVQRISDKLLETLEEFTRDRAKMPPKSPPRRLDPVPVVQVEEPPLDINTIKALPAPSDYEEQPPVTEEPKTPPPQIPPQPPADLVDLREDTVTADAQGNKLALALFSAGATNAEWEPFPSASGGEITSAWQTPAAEQGKADWELALVETTSNLAKQKAALGGGFDPLLLNGMYDQGAVRQHASAQASTGSSSSVVLPGPGKTAKPILALPAPDGSFQSIGGGDPFAASLSVPPPSYVQMSDIEKKQQLLVQERLLWDQYGREGMQGQQGLSSLNNAYYYPNPVIQYGIPQPAPYYYPHITANCFSPS